MVFGYNAVLIVASMMVLYSMMNSVHYGYSMDYSETVSLYVVMAYIEFGMILLIIPAITAAVLPENGAVRHWICCWLPR